MILGMLMNARLIVYIPIVSYISDAPHVYS